MCLAYAQSLLTDADKRELRILSSRTSVFENTPLVVFDMTKDSVDARRAAGLLSLKYTDGAGHLVFFVVDFEEETVAIVDPNAGRGRRATERMVGRFFNGFSVQVMSTTLINLVNSHDNPEIYAKLQQLNISDALLSTDIKGYCATMAVFSLFDFVCSAHWRRTGDTGHYLRVSNDWLFENEMNRNSTPMLIQQIRAFLFAQSFAWMMYRAVDPDAHAPSPSEASLRVTIANKGNGSYLMTSEDGMLTVQNKSFIATPDTERELRLYFAHPLNTAPKTHLYDKSETNRLHALIFGTDVED